MAIAYASSMARAGLIPRVSTASLCSRLPALPCLPSRSVSTSFKHSSASNRLAPFQIKASPSEESSDSVEVGEVFLGLKDKWDALENKSAFILYGGGAIVVLWLSSVIVGAINSVPVVPKAMELVGVGYTGWFVYRYLLFKSSRKELAAEIEALKKKIAGSEYS
ncbi:protein CURVATURE THYLAKOID 1A, chloroplastic-like isoform X2 [Actinidia eriantha]|uniref:protein CURVATURE THYLAKOID 1A, chloroplastic-like isoform X2 n=1 Tax=Actinidia eriantha TaxID=165200 RepID=UPI002585085C|nr:protein CURVATURE THYLAKOID 1A, chloroplastic-like isoform X2 [Actinidia eriantha]